MGKYPYISKEHQEALKAIGLYDGDIDERLGPRTREALERCEKLQRDLKARGFYDGAIDRWPGPKTMAAIRECMDWQRWLKSKNFYHGAIDGWPGELTDRAIRDFQRDRKIKVDGIVGPSTENARRHYAGPVKRVVNKVKDTVVRPVVNAVYGKSRWPDIGVHISASSFGDAKIIDYWHRLRGFKKGGYNEVVLVDGTAQTGDEYPQWLRRSDEVGAHIKGYNHKVYGICVISLDGNINQAQWDYLTRRIKELRTQGIKGKLVGFENVKGHREYPNVRKFCPGMINMSKVRQIVGA